jgi:glucokinase
MKSNGLGLVGDFGGTHVRLGLADLMKHPLEIRGVRHFLSKDFKSGIEPVAAYINDLAAAEKPSVAALAVAGPVSNGEVQFTNLGWSLSVAGIEALGIAEANLVNDYVAMAYATELFAASDVHRIGPGAADARGNIAVIGPGTGFGASALVFGDDGSKVAIPSEGGHASFAPDDETEIEALRRLQHKFVHVSVERILSGPGLCNLHDTLNAMEGISDDVLDPGEITQQALAGEAACLRTLNRFCGILGSVAGNFALSYGAQGGVYIAGGIAPDILGLLDGGDFRRRFEAKGRFEAYLRAIPTLVITKPDATLLGAAEVARRIDAGSPKVSGN